MNISPTRIAPTDLATKAEPSNGLKQAIGFASGTATPVAYGSGPAASLNVSAQAKAYAIKHGHDPDGVQDGK